MKYKFNFGSDVVVIPRSAARYLKEASGERLAVLFSLAAEPSMTAKKRAESLSMSQSALAEAISFWLALGVISAANPDENAVASEEASERNDKETPPVYSRGEKSGRGKKPGALENNAPHLTTKELSRSAYDGDNAYLIEHCQHLMGRVFNAAEAERIVSVRSYLDVSSDFIARLCSRLKSEGKLSVRALEKAAIELHDLGVDDEQKLSEYFERRDAARTLESKVRSLYGLGRRALTPAERKMLDKWASLEMSADMIELAYELTVNNTSNASLKYSNAIIEAWGAAGVKTVEDAKKHEKEFKARTSQRGARKGKNAGNTPSSFDTENFFENALRRSYGDEFYESYKNADASDSSKNENK